MLNLLMSEIKFQARHYSVWGALLLLFAFGLFLINKQTPDTDIASSGVYFLITTFAIQILMLPGLVALFISRASVRDFEQNMSELVYAAAPLRSPMLIARLIVLIVICTCVYIAFGSGIIAGLVTDPQASISLAFKAIAWSVLVLVVPSVLLMTSLCFAIGLRAKQSIHVYVFAAMLFFCYQFFLMASGSPLMASRVAPDENLMMWFAALDPYGLSGFFASVHQWLPEQKNTQLPELTGLLLSNRLGVCMLALSIAGWSIGAHNRASHITSKRVSQRPLLGAMKKLSKKIKPSKSILPAWPLISVASMAIRLLMSTRIFVAMCLFLAVVAGSEIYFGYVHLENMGTRATASTMITLNRYIGDVLPTFCGLFLLLISAEVCWRDNQSNFSHLVDSTQVNNDVLFTGRLMALCIVPLLFISLVIVLSIGLQFSFGGSIDWLAYAQLYPYIGLPLVALAILCNAIHHLLPNKYLAMALTVVVYAWLESSLLANFGLEHPLWTLGHKVVLKYSELFGMGGKLDAFWATTWLRLSFAILVALLCIKRLRRGNSLTGAIKHRPRKTSVGVVAASVAMVMALSNLVLATHYEGHYQSTSQRHAWKAGYEKRYGHLQHAASLSNEEVVMSMELDPSNKRIAIQGTYHLINRTDSPIDSLMLTTPQPFVFSNVAVNLGQLQQYDDEYQTYRYSFAQPVMPGEGATLTFTADYYGQGLEGNLSDRFISDSLVYLRMLRFMPWMGFVEHYALKDNKLRATFDLPQYQSNTLEQDMAMHKGDMSAKLDWAKLDTTIITDADHTAFAPGRLVSQWLQDGKRGFRYTTHGPVRNLHHIVSTNLPYLQDEVEGINAQVFYPPGREKWAHRHMRAIKNTLAYGNQHFGQLNGFDIRLVPATYAFPSTGYALPQTIFIGEGVGFHVDLQHSDGFDHLYRRTAHEIAHQWWGNDLNGAATEGEGVLIETLAKYTEGVLLAQEYGDDYVNNLIEFEQRRYMEGRSRTANTELPLYRADDPYLIYSKGTAAMYAIAQVIGEDAVNTALAKLVAEHSYPSVPATTLDLIKYLQLGASEAEKHFIDGWFYDIKIHDIAIREVTVNQVDAVYQTRICIASHKDPIDQVELIAKDNRDETIATMQVSMDDTSDGEQCIDWSLSQAPTMIEADPRLLMMDSDRSNNRLRPIAG